MKEQHHGGEYPLQPLQRTGFFRRMANRAFRTDTSPEVPQPFVVKERDPTPRFSDTPAAQPEPAESLPVETSVVNVEQPNEHAAPERIDTIPTPITPEATQPSQPMAEPEAQPQAANQYTRPTLVEFNHETRIIHFYDTSSGTKGKEVAPPAHFRAPFRSKQSFDLWAQIHQLVETDRYETNTPRDSSNYAAKQIVTLSQKRHDIPTLTTTQVHELRNRLPPMQPDIFRTPQRQGFVFLFGHVAFSSAYPQYSHRKPEIVAEQPKPAIPEKKIPVLETRHPDLTTLDHAVLNITWQGETRTYCLPMDSRQTILLARTIEAIALLRHDTEKRQQRNIELGITPDDARSKATGSIIAQQAWARMSEMERQLFTHNKASTPVNQGGAFIKNELTNMLRSRTNKLRLTHERHSDQFSLLVPAENISFSYSEIPPTAEEIDSYRKLPGASTVVKPLEIPATQAEALLGQAQLYIDIIRSEAAVADDMALDILDFVMMREGRWAIRQLSVNEKGTRNKIGVGTIHSYLRKRSGGTGMYEVGLENRLIGGTAVRKGSRSGNAGQIGGALPGKSNETIGKEEQAVRDYRISDKLASDEI